MLSIGRVQLKNPFIVASGPITRSAELLKKADRAGAAAASIKLTLLEQPFPASLRIFTDPGIGAISSQDRRLDVDEARRVIQRAKAETDLILLSNITHRADDVEGWIELATNMQDAGADAIEANFTCGNIALTSMLAGTTYSAPAGALIGQDPALAHAVTSALTHALEIPVVCKLTSRVKTMVDTAVACVEGGAAALTVGGGATALPPVDIFHPDVSPYGLARGVTFGGQLGEAVRYQAFANVALCSRAVNVPIVGVGGLTRWEHAIQYMMWGATFVSACTSIMWHGFDWIAGVLQGMERFLDEGGYPGYEEVIGRAQPLIRSAFDLEYLAGSAVVHAEQCTGCGLCLRPGHCEAVRMTDGGARVDPALCLGCAICARLCPTGAIEMVPASQ